jgi:transcriptional regulator with XRE-family HTH domain
MFAVRCKPRECTSSVKAPLAIHFGEVLRARREAAGLSQEALASATKLHRVYISLLERGERAPSLTTVLRLATALDTTMSSLLIATERRLSKD